MVLEVQRSDSNARLDFGLEESTQAAWLDNVSVRSIETNDAGLDGRMRLLTNPSQLYRVVILDSDYLSVDGTLLPQGTQVRLRPMEGRVLIRP